MIAHEYASIFPMLSQDELKQLAADIKLNGLNNPIITHEGKILDGRNRYEACKISDIPPRFDEYHGDDPLAFVFSQNFTRRQLTESQKGMIAARYAQLDHGSNQYKVDVSGDTSSSTAKSRKEAADMVGVGEATVGRARAILNHGVPELAAAVDAGQVTVNAAVQVAKLPPDEQRVVVKAGPDAIRATAKKQVANTSADSTDTAAPSPQTRARVPSVDVSNARDVWIQAKLLLKRILKNDRHRVEVLKEIISYCQNRIDTNQ